MNEVVQKCPFCDIETVAGRILYKNNLFFVLENILPIVEHHILVIPFDHIREEADILPENWQFYRMAIRWADRYIKDHSGKDVFSFLNAPSGQSVLHYHRHLLPNPFVAHGADTALREYLVHKNGA